MGNLLENSFYEETLEIIEENKKCFGSFVACEAIRLLNSGAIDKNNHNRATLFKAAFQNVADQYVAINRKEYKNLLLF